MPRSHLHLSTSLKRRGGSPSTLLQTARRPQPFSKPKRSGLRTGAGCRSWRASGEVRAMTAADLVNRFVLARSAYRRRDAEAARAAHAHHYLERSLYETGRHGQHLADSVLGATDGVVTTFAVVAGAAG